MKSAEHKKAAEDLLKNVDEQSKLVEAMLGRGAGWSEINAGIALMHATAAKAGVHATLATIVEPFTHDSFTSAP